MAELEGNIRGMEEVCATLREDPVSEVSFMDCRPDDF